MSKPGTFAKVPGLLFRENPRGYGLMIGKPVRSNGYAPDTEKRSGLPGAQ
ncbi:MAG: hypothetical protein OSB10_04610 [Planctomycetota bacterium]|nr:hypothetical protein [Planctomycetota bacterium]